MSTVPTSPTFLPPAEAAAVLRAKLDPRAPVTVADAATRSGLALRDAERGLQALSSEYRGRLRVTDDGDLVHVFPTGFTKPWETRDAIDRALGAVGRAIAGAARFVTRAWIAIVLVGYTLLFLALLLGITFAGRSSNDDSRGSSAGVERMLGAFLRIVGDALFWTFHPFSPFAVGMGPGGYGYGHAFHPGHGADEVEARDARPKIPLYERVNRFFYGPRPEPEDPHADEAALLAAIRAGQGRIGLGDVMRVTGLPRDQADPMMARLMLDYDGDVDVGENGGIVYRFPALRRTAGPLDRAPAHALAEKPAPELAPLTGNGVGTNLAIVAVNAFNLLMASFALTHDLTLANVAALFSRVPGAVFEPGTAVALGVVPLVFSLLMFVIPLARALLRPWQRRRVADERGRLAVRRDVIARTRRGEPVTDGAAEAAWSRAAGEPANRVRVARELEALGGNVEIAESGATRWRFVDLETEASDLEAERAAASPDEARLGRIVFDTESPEPSDNARATTGASRVRH